MTPRTNVLFRTCYHACCFNHECIVLLYIFNDLFSCSHRQSLYGVDLSNKVVVSLATSSVIGLSRKSLTTWYQTKRQSLWELGLPFFLTFFLMFLRLGGQTCDKSTNWCNSTVCRNVNLPKCAQSYSSTLEKKTNGRNSNDIFKVDKYISNTQFTKYSQCVLIQMIFQHSNEIVKVHGPF